MFSFKSPRARQLLVSGVLVAGLLAANAAQAQTITLSNRSVSTTYQPQFPGATAYYVLDFNGNIIVSNPQGTNGSDVGDWLTPKINIGNFQVRATSSTCGGSATGVWLPLSTSRYWFTTAMGPAPQSSSCTANLEISAIANPSVILGSATIGLTAYY
jgi:hypothetical protein